MEDRILLSGSPMSDVTRILSAIEQGDPQASEQLLPLVYQELRRLAAQKMARENPGQTLQATALVHEAYIRLVDVEDDGKPQGDFAVGSEYLVGRAITIPHFRLPLAREFTKRVVYGEPRP